MTSSSVGGSAAEAPTVLSLAVPAAASAPPGLPAWQRTGLRFLCLYYLLYAFPRPLTLVLETFVGAGSWVDTTWSTHTAALAPFRWCAHWLKELAKVETRGWQELTTWLSQQGLTPYEVIHQRTGSGDTAHDIAKLLVALAAAALGAFVWSVLASGRGGRSRGWRWLHLWVRFDLAFWMLSYGGAKLYGTQFGELGLMRLTTEVGDLRPMTMVGTFMQGSPAYEVFSGVGEVLGGLLLFHPRTALLGACVTVAVMANVAALNWLYGVPVKLFSLHLLLAGGFLTLPYAGRLWSLFVSNRASQPVDLSLARAPWTRWPLWLAGHLFVLVALFLQHVQSTAPKTWMAGQAKPALYGLWVVDSMQRDGQDVPKTDATRWRHLAIDRGTLVWVRDLAGTRRFFDCTWEATTNGAPTTGVVKDRGAAAEAPGQPWTFTLGEKVVPAEVPLLLTDADRQRTVDTPRRTVTLKGQIDGKPIEVVAVEKVFRLQTPFRFRQELPDFW